MRSGTISVIALFLVNKYFWPWPELPLTCHSGLSMTICHKADKPSLNFYSKWVNIGSFLRKKLGPAPQMKILPWAITWHLDCRALGESWYILCMVSWRLWNFQASHQDRIQIRVWVHTLRVWMFFFLQKKKFVGSGIHVLTIFFEIPILKIIKPISIKLYCYVYDTICRIFLILMIRTGCKI